MSGTLAALLLLAVGGDPLEVHSYVELSVEMLQRGNAGWSDVVELLEEGHGEGSEAVAAAKRRMAAEEERLLREHGITREEFEGYYGEHREAVDRYLLDHEERQRQLLELTAELRDLLRQYAHLTADRPPGATEEGASEESPRRL